EHFPQYAAERPDVGALVHSLAARLFGTHVCSRADDQSFARVIDRNRRSLGDPVGAVAPGAYARSCAALFAGVGGTWAPPGARSPAPGLELRQTKVEHLHGAVRS